MNASSRAASTRAPAGVDAAVAEAAREGLLRARKRLPAWLLYDARGSELFEEITRLPEYYLTRTERAVLAEHAGAIVDAAGGPLEIVELGAGSAVKTRLLLEALLARQRRVRYVPVDVSASALGQARVELGGLGGLAFEPVVARYPEELGFLRAPARGLRKVADRRLVLFLGSNIGNYDARAAVTLLAAVRRHLAPGDALLVGADRRKSAALLRPAYDDAAGVTAAFNRNVLVRLNRELGATFDLRLWAHVVRWNQRASRVELYLESRAAQRVELAALGARVDFAAGERIHTESSYKLSAARLRGLLARAGLAPERAWLDERRWFGVTLARVPAR
ncbi:MAG TPA: L-histidine N(alpha)-methyltransferase [Polyangia bacterium]|jgi:dimethylhistidine N-methyltransferase|nr:L-histidine N(alpha)-methyltransferase [Polyangia bacterium]